MAATWDAPLHHDMADVIATEARAKHNEYAAGTTATARQYFGLTFWTPNINIFRDPRWGRGQETYGEDPFLTAQWRWRLLAVCRATIPTTQGDGVREALRRPQRAGSDAASVRRRGRPSAISTKPTCRISRPPSAKAMWAGDGRLQLRVWQPGVREPVAALDLLRGNGASTAMWFRTAARSATFSTTTTPRPARTRRGQRGPGRVRPLLRHGIQHAGARGGPEHVESRGTLIRPSATFSKPLSARVVRPARNGALMPHRHRPERLQSEHQALALRAARESIVLLKNNGALPLNRAKIKRIAVIGANAAWCRSCSATTTAHRRKPITILDGLRRSPGTASKSSMKPAARSRLQPMAGVRRPRTGFQRRRRGEFH